MNYKSKEEVSVFSLIGNKSWTVVYLIASVAIGLYLVITQVSMSEVPILYVFFFLVTLYALLILLINFLTKKIIKIHIDHDNIHFTYQFMTQIHEEKWSVSDTNIELIELKNYSAHFDGFEIQFSHISENKKLKLVNKYWRYIDFEKIYSDLTTLKKEDIATQQKELFAHLQMMNNTTHESAN